MQSPQGAEAWVPVLEPHCVLWWCAAQSSEQNNSHLHKNQLRWQKVIPAGFVDY